MNDAPCGEQRCIAVDQGVSEIHGKPGLRRVTPAAKMWRDDLAPGDPMFPSRPL